MHNPSVVIALAAATVSASSGFDPLGNSFGVPGKNASYDYVVVGGGTAGLTIAARLAEGSNTTVAVVEAGGFYQMDNGNGRSVYIAKWWLLILMLTHSSVIPGLCGAQGVDADAGKTLPQVDRNFTTTPQSGLGGRSIHYARGKTMGGFSALNFMVYHRGTKGPYDKWADEVADDSYTFDNLLP
jgi:choline dehydrogenase